MNIAQRADTEKKQWLIEPFGTAETRMAEFGD
jgi:hypothetical protein